MPQSEADLEKDGKKFILSENARKAASILLKSKYCQESNEKKLDGPWGRWVVVQFEFFPFIQTIYEASSRRA
jgi:hypothetical protein